MTQPDSASEPADLTWLLNRAAQRMRAELDAVARQHGLAGLRDWIVLSALTRPGQPTQLRLGRELGIDKTTLTTLLDRLEAGGLVVRRPSPTDRRARLPHITDAGRALQTRIAQARDATETQLLENVTPHERRLLRDLLARLAHGADPGICL